MNKFDAFCNLILEVYTKVNVPYDGRNAPERYNNPGGAYPFKNSKQYGMEGVGTIGGGHKIAKYPTVESGIAANIAHLKSMPIIGKTVGQARHYWVNGNFNGSKALTGMDSNQVITQELLNDPNWLSQWMVGTARDEGFPVAKLTAQTMNKGLAMAGSGAATSSQYAAQETPATQTDNNTANTTAANNTQGQPNAEDANKAENDPIVGGYAKTLKDIYANVKGGGEITSDIAKQGFDVANKAAQGFLKTYSKKA